MEIFDDDLSRFETYGGAPLPVTDDQGTIEHDGARIWYAAYGSGPPVILLHGGLGHSGNWGYQVPPLVRNGYRTVVTDSRGHGRSTRDERPYTYELMAADVSAVMDALHLQKVALAGWSDGAVGLMQRTQPNFSAADLAEISVPVAIVHSEHDEFIKREHAEYLAHTIPHAEFIYLPGVSHFAPLQRPQQFNSAMLVFLINTLA